MQAHLLQQITSKLSTDKVYQSQFDDALKCFHYNFVVCLSVLVFELCTFLLLDRVAYLALGQALVWLFVVIYYFLCCLFYHISHIHLISPDCVNMLKELFSFFILVSLSFSRNHHNTLFVIYILNSVCVCVCCVFNCLFMLCTNAHALDQGCHNSKKKLCDEVD